MRLLVLGLLALLVSAVLAPPAGACPPGYVSCGEGVCCPR